MTSNENDVEVNNNPEESNEDKPQLTSRFVEFSRLVEEKLPIFREKVDELGKNELKRVVKAIVEFPVEQTIVIQHPKEAKVAEIGIQLKQAMAEMSMEAVEIEKAKLIAKKEKEDANEENKEQENGGEEK